MYLKHERVLKSLNKVFFTIFVCLQENKRKIVLFVVYSDFFLQVFNVIYHFQLSAGIILMVFHKSLFLLTLFIEIPSQLYWKRSVSKYKTIDVF